MGLLVAVEEEEEEEENRLWIRSFWQKTGAPCCRCAFSVALGVCWP
eukprot:COSAG06_NODE_1481_length_9319_cov_264.596963_5_plen_46_part_00